MPTPAPVVPPTTSWLSIPPEPGVLDLVSAPDLRERRRSLVRTRALILGGITIAGLLVSIVVIWRAFGSGALPGGLVGAVLLALTSRFPGEATTSRLNWLSVDRTLNGLYLRLTSQYIEYGHDHGRWSAPWAAVRAIRVIHPDGFDPDVVLLRVEADGWGPFTVHGPVGYVDILAHGTDIDLGLVNHLANYATLGRLTLHPEPSQATDSEGEAASPETAGGPAPPEAGHPDDNQHATPAAASKATTVPADDAVQAVPHPRWCDPQECLAVQDEFHPVAPPPMHLSRRYTADPSGRGRTTWVAAQLVQFIGDPRPQRTFVGLRVAEMDTEQTFYIDTGQGTSLGRALLTLTGQAKTSEPADASQGAPRFSPARSAETR